MGWAWRGVGGEGTNELRLHVPGRAWASRLKFTGTGNEKETWDTHQSRFFKKKKKKKKKRGGKKRKGKQESVRDRKENLAGIDRTKVEEERRSKARVTIPEWVNEGG